MVEPDWLAHLHGAGAAVDAWLRTLPLDRGWTTSRIALVAGLGIGVVALGVWLAGRPRYQAQQRLFTAAEFHFLKALRAAIEPGEMVFAKVRVADLITPRGRPNGRGWWRHFRRISSKHIDFVVVAEADGAIRIAIELDDASHRRSDRRRRDAFLNRAFAEAGVPLLRPAVQQRYAVEVVRAWLREAGAGAARAVTPPPARRPARTGRAATDADAASRRPAVRNP